MYVVSVILSTRSLIVIVQLSVGLATDGHGIDTVVKQVEESSFGLDDTQ